MGWRTLPQVCGIIQSSPLPVISRSARWPLHAPIPLAVRSSRQSQLYEPPAYIRNGGRYEAIDLALSCCLRLIMNTDMNNATTVMLNTYVQQKNNTLLCSCSLKQQDHVAIQYYNSPKTRDNHLAASNRQKRSKNNRQTEYWGSIHIGEPSDY